jgi:hypothetical protein
MTQSGFSPRATRSTRWVAYRRQRRCVRGLTHALHCSIWRRRCARRKKSLAVGGSDRALIVFARVVGRSTPIKLYTISLKLSKVDAGTYLVGGVGILFELEWDTGEYRGHEYTILSEDDEHSN